MKKLFLIIIIMFSFSLCSAHSELSFIEQMDRDIVVNSETISNGTAYQACREYVYKFRNLFVEIQNNPRLINEEELLAYVVHFESKIKLLPYEQQKYFSPMLPILYEFSYGLSAINYFSQNDYKNAYYYSKKVIDIMLMNNLIERITPDMLYINIVSTAYLFSTSGNYSYLNLAYINMALESSNNITLGDVNSYKALLYFFRSVVYIDKGLKTKALEDLKMAELYNKNNDALNKIIKNMKSQIQF